MKASRQEEGEYWDIIMSDFQKKEERSYKLIFDHLYGQLVYFCFQYVKDAEVAEEIVSDSFLKLFERSTNFKFFMQVKSFLYATAKNASIDYLKKTKTYERVKSEYQHTIQETDSNTFDLEMFHIKIMHSIFLELQKVAPLAKKVFELRYLQNLKPRKVSEITGLSYQTVKNQTKIARAYLKQSSFLWKKFSDL